MTTNKSTKQKALVSFVVLCVVAILIVGVQATKHKSTPQVAAQASATTATSSSASSGGTYKDGEYMASGKYSSPGGTQTLMVDLTIASNKVTAASVTPSAKDGVAQVYQNYFVMNFKPLVIGKDISSLKLSRVSGSSLTSKGFNEALLQIKKQAS